MVKALSDFDKRNLEIVNNVAVYSTTHLLEKKRGLLSGDASAIRKWQIDCVVIKFLIKDAVKYHFDEDEGPRIIRLHISKQEVLAL